ncbi:MAG TPA: hypothetical protein VF427_10930 [Noviherbaspirillum sp.]
MSQAKALVLEPNGTLIAVRKWLDEIKEKSHVKKHRFLAAWGVVHTLCVLLRIADQARNINTLLRFAYHNINDNKTDMTTEQT